MSIPITSSLVHYYKVFYGYAGKKLFFLCFIILAGGICEGLGISMLLPILDYGQPKTAHNAYAQTVYQFIESIGIGVSLFSLLALLLIVFSLKGVFVFVQATLSLYITTNLLKTLKVGLSQRYGEMSYSYYANNSIGYLNNIITTETGRAVGSFRGYIDIIVNMIFIFIYVLSAFIINWRWTVLVLVICFCMFAALRSLSRIARKLSLLTSETNSQIQSLLIQTINNFKYLKASDSIVHLLKQLHKKIDENISYRFKSGVLIAIPTSIIEPATVLFLSGLIFYHVGYNKKTMAEIFILLIFFYKAFSRIFTFQIIWQKFNAAIGGIETIKEATKGLDLNREIVGSNKVKHFKENIELKGVNFSYGHKKVLFDINITIPKNKTIGIVGKSGAGKTTLFDILTGLVVPQSGNIIMDGIPYRDLNMRELRRRIGYVTQEPVMFNDTIANNVSLWECDISDILCRKKIKTAAKHANCIEFVNENKDGFETIVGDKGVKLSGGQCQRIAIARELYKEPEIMIFDEATSSLDAESEMFIQRSINSMIGKRTIVVIAHRLSTIKNCDCIYVLKDGRIVEEGSFDELYRDTNSRFYSMCQAQNL